MMLDIKDWMVIYQNKGTNEYIVGEAKYNTSKLSTLKDGTKQMSKKWIGGKLS